MLDYVRIIKFSIIIITYWSSGCVICGGHKQCAHIGRVRVDTVCTLEGCVVTWQPQWCSCTKQVRLKFYICNKLLSANTYGRYGSFC